MSCKTNLENKRHFSDDNIILDSKQFFNIEKEIKDEKIIKEILEKKIHININYLKDNFINYKPRRYHSHIPSRKMEYLSDFYNTTVKFNEWIKYNEETNEQIKKCIIKLLKEIFDKRYKLYPNNMCTLSPYALKIKENVEIFCTKFKELSVYILYILYTQFYPLLQYIDENIHCKLNELEEMNKIKEIFYFIGKDISKIFKPAFDNTENFKISSVLIIMLQEYLYENNIIKTKVIKNIALYNESNIFEQYLKIIYNLSFQKDYEKILNKKLFLDVDNNNNNKENKNNKNNKKNNNIIEIKIITNNIKQDDKYNENKDIKKSQNKTNNAQDLNIEDLVNYINAPKNESNKKKKKKKKKGKNHEKTIEKQNNNNDKDNFEEDLDLVYLNYKKSIEEFSQSVLPCKKISPKLNDEFLKRLEILSK